MAQLSLNTALGPMSLAEEDGRLVSVDWGWARDQRPTPLLERGADLLQRYFDGEPVVFDLPLGPAGTPFQHRVWQALSAIPYGRTVTYGQLAGEIGNGSRAVASACGRNPIPIVVPCHRVVAASGLGGYSGDGGVDTKIQLLRLEGALL